MLHARADDTFWAARRVMAFSDEMLRAIVKMGQYSDPAAEQLLAEVLIKRRHKIGKAYLPAVNPVVDFRLDSSGSLTFENAAVKAGLATAPRGGYEARWHRFDNSNGNAAPIGAPVVSRLVKYLGVPICVAALPCISLCSYNVLAFYPVIGIMVAAKVAENSTGYSLNNTVKNMLFLPCTRDEKYSTKQLIDSFFARVGDVLSAVPVFVGTTNLKLNARGFAMANVILVIVWLILALRVGRRYQALTSNREAIIGRTA